MAQYVFWNWKDDDATKALNERFLGLLPSGLYRGFDAIRNGSLTLELSNVGSSSFEFTTIDTKVREKRGMTVSNQGVVIHESDSIFLEIEPGHPTLGRIDIIVQEHEYVYSQGASQAIYRVITGTPGTPAPPVPDPDIQIKLGEIFVPAGVTALNATGCYYEKSIAPRFNDNSYDYDFLLASIQTNANNIQNNTLSISSNLNLIQANQTALAALSILVGDNADDIDDLENDLNALISAFGLGYYEIGTFGGIGGDFVNGSSHIAGDPVGYRINNYKNTIQFKGRLDFVHGLDPTGFTLDPILPFTEERIVFLNGKRTAVPQTQSQYCVTFKVNGDVDIVKVDGTDVEQEGIVFNGLELPL